MTRFFLSEPGVMIAEQCPGPSYFDGLDPVVRPSVPSAGQLGAGLAIELAKAQELRRQYADARLSSPEPPAEETFIDIVDTFVRAGMSYGQACKEASMSRPDLYAEHRARSML